MAVDQKATSASWGAMAPMPPRLGSALGFDVAQCETLCYCAILLTKNFGCYTTLSRDELNCM